MKGLSAPRAMQGAAEKEGIGRFFVDKESDPPRLNSIIKHLQIVPCAHLKSSHHSMSLIGGITPE